MATSNRMFPSPSDSVAELQRKYDVNIKASASEIPHYIIDEHRDHDELTEYQSNAMTAKRYIEDKKKDKKHKK